MVETVRVPCPQCGEEIDVEVEFVPGTEEGGDTATLHVHARTDEAIAAHDCPGPAGD
jgi:hypothetical protein